MNPTAQQQAAAPPPRYRRPMVTDGGMETDLIFHHGVDLPYFAAFPLVETDEGQALLTAYYDGYAAVARRAGAGLMLEAPTWRANPDWGARLGYGPAGLARVNAAAIALLGRLRDRYTGTISDVVIGGMVGPRGDGYRHDELMTPDQAAAYHGPQVRAFAAAGADLVTAYTLADTGEAAGITRAARQAGLPVAISFTLETDGRLPSGDTLAGAVARLDASDPPDYFLVNCAHPEHVSRALDGHGRWRERLAGVRYNASAKSHAELDEAADLDEGDPVLLAQAHRRLKPLLPRLAILGGCCGTDARHVASLWAVA
jgi:homocysteine S-methyltransferase